MAVQEPRQPASFRYALRWIVRRVLVRGVSPATGPETPAVCATRGDRGSAWHLNG